MVKDLELKRDLIDSNKYRLYKKCEWLIHYIESNQMKLINRLKLANSFGISLDISNELNEVNQYKINYWEDGLLIELDYEKARFYIQTLYNSDDLRVCYNLKQAQCKRQLTLKNYIKYLINNYDCVFLTLTFTDETLKKTNFNTRKQMVYRYLSKQTNGLYVANVDYGKTNEREHYHALCPVGLNFKEWHKYGAIKGKKVVVKNEGALSTYIAKFQNHATKETTRNARTIYGKELKRILSQNKEVFNEKID